MSFLGVFNTDTPLSNAQLDSPVITSRVNIGTPTTRGTVARLTSALGQTATIEWFKGTLKRWNIQNRSTAETGKNAGSGLSITAFDDAGNSLGQLFTARRGSGPMGVGRPDFADFAPYDMVLARAASPGQAYGNTYNFSNGTGGDTQPVTALGPDPISVVANSPTVTIQWPGACVPNGPITTSRDCFVKISNAADVGGIVVSGWLRVQSIVDSDHFTVTWTANANDTVTGGGTGVTIQPSYSINGERFFSNHTTGAGSYSVQYQRTMYVNPAFYQSAPANGVQYQHTYTQFYTAPDTTGTHKFGHVGWEADYINRGGDFGYKSLPYNSVNPTVGIWAGPIDLVDPVVPGGGAAHNWLTVFALKGQYGTVGCYQGFLITPSALVGAAKDPTGHGGVGFDVHGAYLDLANNPFTTSNGTSQITVTAPLKDYIDALANGDTVYIPQVYSFNGVTFGGGNYTIANKSGATFQITGTGTATRNGSGGGANQAVFPNPLVPFAWTQLWGSWKHGLVTTNFRVESGNLVETQPGNGFAWNDGTGTASVNAVATSPGNIDITLTPAGTGRVTVGRLKVTDLPTVDPHDAGVLWLNNGVLSVSAG